MKRKVFILFFVFVFVGRSHSQFYNEEVEANISLEIKDNSYAKIKGLAFNKGDINKSIKYRLAVIKNGIAGNSNNEQSGRIVLEPGEKKGLSETAVNIKETDTTIVLLLLYEDEKIVGKDRRVLHGLKDLGDLNQNTVKRLAQNKDVKNNKDDGMVLKGIVLEDTKTKAGTDFYNFFYSKYLENKIEGNKIVTVKEELSLANTTKIVILVEKDVVVEFIINPRTDYLRRMADVSIRRVYNYFLRKEKTKNQIVRY